jgi:hypothetical protein
LDGRTEWIMIAKPSDTELEECCLEPGNLV